MCIFGHYPGLMIVYYRMTFNHRRFCKIFRSSFWCLFYFEFQLKMPKIHIFYKSYSIFQTNYLYSLEYCFETVNKKHQFESGLREHTISSRSILNLRSKTKYLNTKSEFINILAYMFSINFFEWLCGSSGLLVWGISAVPWKNRSKYFNTFLWKSGMKWPNTTWNVESGMGWLYSDSKKSNYCKKKWHTFFGSSWDEISNDPNPGRYIR